MTAHVELTPLHPNRVWKRESIKLPGIRRIPWQFKIYSPEVRIFIGSTHARFCQSSQHIGKLKARILSTQQTSSTITSRLTCLGAVGFTRDLTGTLEAHKITERLSAAFEVGKAHLADLTGPTLNANRGTRPFRDVVRRNRAVLGKTTNQTVDTLGIDDAGRPFWLISGGSANPTVADQALSTRCAEFARGNSKALPRNKCLLTGTGIQIQFNRCFG